MERTNKEEVKSVREGINTKIESKGTRKQNLRKFWRAFRYLAPNSLILRASLAINDKHFKIGSRGLQAIPCCITAIVYSDILSPDEWTRDIINSILDIGDKVFRISRSKYRIPADVQLTTDFIYPKFFIEDYKCHICVTGKFIHGKLFTETSNCPNFQNGVQNFFKSSKAGVLTTQGISVAIWYKNGAFYYFNPNSCDESGLENRDGVACLIRFNNCLNDLLDFSIKTLNTRCDSDYCIDGVEILRMTQINVDISNLQIVTVKETEKDKMCVDPTKESQSVSKASRVSRVPVHVSSDNNAQSMAVNNLIGAADAFDTDRIRDDVRVNIPSTFVQVSDQKFILHGWSHEQSDVYKGKGLQNVADCLVSIGMKKIQPVETWLRSTLDDILVLGDAIHISLKSEKPNLKDVTAIHFDNYKFKIQNQSLIIKVDILTIIGTLSSRKTSVLNLKQALEEFFLSNDSGIIETSIMATAIWREKKYYYMFDPRQCDSNGFRVVEEKMKSGGKQDNKDRQKEKKVIGKCCVIKFIDSDFLATHFLLNVPPGKKNDRFLIRNINVSYDIPGTQPWFNFKPGEFEGTWILRGGATIEIDKSNEKNRIFQSIANSIACLVLAKRITASKWTREVVDHAVQIGEEYYDWCLSPDQDDQQFDYSNLKKALYIDNDKVHLELEEAISAGNMTVNAKTNLETEIVRFFEIHQSGVIEVVNKDTFAIWTEAESKDASSKVYYVSFKDPKNNIVCVMRMLSPTGIAKTIVSYLESDLEETLDFLIHRVNATQTETFATTEEIEADKNSGEKPDLFKYSMLNDETACLTGSFNQSNELIFNEQTRDKQQAGVAIIALVMTKLYNPHLWSREVIDDILELGDKVIAENMISLSEVDAETRDWLLPSEIANDFNLGINRIHLEIQEDTFTGKLDILTDTLKKFFEDSIMGIFRLDRIIMPIWKQGSVFFTLDPRGRDNQGGLNDKDGVAAVLWFTSIPALAADLRNSSTGDTDFSIDLVTVENNFETKLNNKGRGKRMDMMNSDGWYNFKKESDKIWSLSGNPIDENLLKSKHKEESAAIAAMTIVFSRIYKPHEWTAEHVDEVVKMGEKLHQNCIIRFGIDVIPRVTEVMSEIFIADRRINLSIKDCVQSGGIPARNSNKIQDLQSGIVNFFSQYSSGILYADKSMNLALWSYDDHYYILLPELRLMRFASTADLANYILENLNVIDYEIFEIDLRNWNKRPPWKFDPSTFINPHTLPALNAFKRLKGPARAILSSVIYQDSDLLSAKSSSANCVTALGMSTIKSPDTWTKSTLDEILSSGNSLYRNSLKTCPNKEKLGPNEIIRILHLGDNVLTADISVPVVKGLVSNPPPESDTKDKKTVSKKKESKKVKDQDQLSESAPITFLEEGIGKFFENYTAGLLVMDRLVVAIWKQLGVFFLYSPNPWSENGGKFESVSTCVAWFACIEPFYNFIYSNLEGAQRYSTFDIHEVILKIVPITPLPSVGELYFCKFPTCVNNSYTMSVERVMFSGIRALSNYERLSEESKRLDGTRNMNDTIFPEENRGLQSTAIGIVAIVVGSIHAPSTWTPEIIDAILLYGDSLHSDSCKLGKINSRNLSPSELQTVLIVGDYRVHVKVSSYTMTGILYSYDVIETLRSFFKNDIAGILHTNNKSLAVSQHFGKFYLFNPSHDYGKRKSDEPACVMKFDDVTSLANAVIYNCNCDQSSIYTLNAISILSLYSLSNAKEFRGLPC